MQRLALILWLFGFVAAAGAQASLQERYEGVVELPSVKIEGQLAKIHTQGLFATDDFFLVTGRLETKPKRAVLLRFSRKDLNSYEFVDITPENIDGHVLDHPGGFDADDEGRFWIPLSTSNRNGPSILCSYEIDESSPLSKLKQVATIPVDDHIGAVCCVGDRLYAANWDTKSVYVWDRNGRLERKIGREELLPKMPDWQIAVQDWKHIKDSPGNIILGGIDKSNLLRKATIQVIDTTQWKIVQSHTLGQRKDVKRPLTNEGLCVSGEKLFLLPEDIGAGAKVLRFKLPAE